MPPAGRETDAGTLAAAVLLLARDTGIPPGGGGCRQRDGACGTGSACDSGRIHGHRTQSSRGSNGQSCRPGACPVSRRNRNAGGDGHWVGRYRERRGGAAVRHCYRSRYARRRGVAAGQGHRNSSRRRRRIKSHGSCRSCSTCDSRRVQGQRADGEGVDEKRHGVGEASVPVRDCPRRDPRDADVRGRNGRLQLGGRIISRGPVRPGPIARQRRWRNCFPRRSV